MARTLLSAPPTDRVGRYPKHTFQVRSLPFIAQPFLLARVRPGETLTNVFGETRFVTDPIVNNIIGWKQSYFLFYVRITDLLQDAMKEMFVDPTNAEVSGFDEGANKQRTYTAKGGVDWLDKCMVRIVEAHFRDEGEQAGDFVTAAGDYIVQIRENSFLNSLTDKDDMPEGDAISGATDAGDLDRLMDAYNMLRALGVSDMTYEDWLRSQGIAIPGKDENEPEMLYQWGDFYYPSNTIDPTDGTPTGVISGVQRITTDRRDKAKFFREPGFLVGVCVTRPKVYFSGLAGSVAGFHQRAWDWTPNYMAAVPEAALKMFAAGTGPLGDRQTDTDAYWLDMSDDLTHGDQWQNMVAFPANSAQIAASYPHHLLPLPATDLNWKYPSEAMCKGFFLDAAGTDFYIRQDGYVNFSIKTMQVDFTPGNLAHL